ncbi:MAG: alpha/beta hydrolase, partial [Bacteroidota bacterium]
MKSILSSFLLLLTFTAFSQEIEAPSQPLTGPGGTEYVCDSVAFHDFAAEPDGYWLFEPISPEIKEAPVIVFVHGYGAMNPMIYGNWIKHLVRRGNIVIFPRYQKNLFSPKPKYFSENVAAAIRHALVELDTGQYVKANDSPLAIVGHSYGGVISANLAVNFEKHGIPQPEAVMLCSPGSGPFKGGVLDSYAAMPANVNLLVMVSENDRIVGDKLGKRVYETAENVSNRNLVRQFADKHGSPSIKAGHNESYSLNRQFDSGNRNMTAKRAKRKTALNAVDYFGYWKLFDALLDCSRNTTHCEIAFGDTPEQRYMGLWSDGTPVKQLEIQVPDPRKLQAKN